MTQIENLAIRDILSWAIANDAHCKYENFKALLEAYWSETLNTNTSIDSMWCDGDSSPLTDWDYSSPQPEINEWDLN